eukprot:4460548-Lingulodinium_polyedra.AAC.1
MASRAGSAGRMPARAWPSLNRLRNAGRLRSGIAARRTASQHGHCQKRCSASSSASPQCGLAEEDAEHRFW